MENIFVIIFFCGFAAVVLFAAIRIVYKEAQAKRESFNNPFKLSSNNAGNHFTIRQLNQDRMLLEYDHPNPLLPPPVRWYWIPESFKAMTGREIYITYFDEQLTIVYITKDHKKSYYDSLYGTTIPYFIGDLVTKENSPEQFPLAA